MNDSSQQRIVVGISGSLTALVALQWAADEARLRQAHLHVVRAWDPARHAAPYAGVGHLPTGDEQEATVRAGLAEAMRAVFGLEIPDGITTELAEGVPERILVARSADADMLVLGVTTPPSLARRSGGPVVRACLARADCPVVIVGSADGAQAPANRQLADAATA